MTLITGQEGEDIGRIIEDNKEYLGNIFKSVVP